MSAPAQARGLHALNQRAAPQPIDIAAAVRELETLLT
jgi:beta-N-acetylhexosaminidase